MKADDIGLLEFIGPGKKLFYIPVYQRNYDWNQKQCTKLFEDIIEIAQSETRKLHFLGSLVYIDEPSAPNTKELSIIDGQQRLTTIMILLKALLDLSNDINIQEEILEDYLINKRSNYEDRIRLKPMKTDADTIRKLIDDDFESIENTQIYHNYLYFKKAIEESHLSIEEIYDGIKKLEIVYIQVDNENPQLVFESLNSTGLDLTQADLIRNFLLMGEDHAKQEQLYNQYWVKLEGILPDSLISEFIRDYLTYKTGSIPNKKEVYNQFKNYYRDLENFDSEGFLDELNTYGKYYHWFKYCDSPNQEINERLEKLQSLKSTVVHPFLLGIFEDYFLYQIISTDELLKTLDIIISYLIRRSLCELPTNALNKVFASLAKDVEKYSDLPISKALSKVLSKKSGKTSFPLDSVLTEKIKNLNAYQFKSIKFILSEIEKSKSKEVVDDSGLTIEHIMPQTLSPNWTLNLGNKADEVHEKYLNNLGNLTLTGYNSDLSNKSFEDKKEIYLESNVCITKSICEYNQWNEDQILKRCSDLTKEIIALWPCPEEIKYAKAKTNTGTDFDFSDHIDVTGRKPQRLEIDGKTKNVKSWKEFLLAVCEILSEYDKDLFKSLIEHKDFKTRNRKLLDVNVEKMRKPVKISNGLYIETNLSANSILNLSKLLISKFEDLEEVSSFKIAPIKY